jgi:hypothetical protein
MSDSTNRQTSDQTALLLTKSRELLQLLTRLLAKRATNSNQQNHAAG